MIIFNNGSIALKSRLDEYTIGKPRKNKEGECVLSNVKHYYSTKHAVMALARRVSDEEAKDLDEWLMLYQETIQTTLRLIEEKGLT